MGSARSSTLVRRWVALYTRGLPPAIGDRRRAEIESDLWAHADEAAALGRAPAALDIEMLLRLVMGVPADLAWRRSHRAAPHAADRKEIEMQSTYRSELSRLGVGIAAVWAAFMALVTIIALIATVTSGGVYWLPAAIIGTAGAGLALLGVLLVDRKPVVGVAIAIVGAAVVARSWAMAAEDTLLLFGVAASLLVVVGAFIRAAAVRGTKQEQPA